MQKEKKVSPILLVTLGATLGAAVIALLFTQTTLFTQKESEEIIATPVPTPTVTVQPTVAPTSFLSPEDEIKQQVITKSGIPVDKLEFSIGEENGTVARGTVKETGTISGAAWFASKSGYVWTVDYIGQGIPECIEVENKGYPITWISHCADTNGSTKAL